MAKSFHVACRDGLHERFFFWRFSMDCMFAVPSRSRGLHQTSQCSMKCICFVQLKLLRMLLWGFQLAGLAQCLRMSTGKIQKVEQSINIVMHTCMHLQNKPLLTGWCVPAIFCPALIYVELRRMVLAEIARALMALAALGKRRASGLAGLVCAMTKFPRHASSTRYHKTNMRLSAAACIGKHNYLPHHCFIYSSQQVPMYSPISKRSSSVCRAAEEMR